MTQIKRLSATGIALLTLAVAVSACRSGAEKKKAENAGKGDTITAAAQQPVNLPAPYASKSVTAYCKVIGWPDGKTPVAPNAFSVMKLAGGFENPRWIYVARNGDIFVAEACTESNPLNEAKSKITGQMKSLKNSRSANRITLLRDSDHDGKIDLQTVFLTGLKQNFGMLIIGTTFYAANTDGVLAFPYRYGQTKISAPGNKIISLPAGGYNNHWTRNIITNSDSSKLFVTVGSGSNVAEHGMEKEQRRADILEFNPDGSGEKVYASGLRNPQGMGWAPGTHTLWVAVNERDEIGDDLVPDYLTSVKEDGFYGWPYSYWGQHADPRLKDTPRADLVAKAIVPDVSMNAHTASLGLAFDTSGRLPGKYAGGAFVGQHGSWNRSALSGYQVAFVPMHEGKSTGSAEPFLTGFIADSAAREVYGRPVGVAFENNGTLLVADDVSNSIWAVTPKSAKAVASR